MVHVSAMNQNVPNATQAHPSKVTKNVRNVSAMTQNVPNATPAHPSKVTMMMSMLRTMASFSITTTTIMTSVSTTTITIQRLLTCQILLLPTTIIRPSTAHHPILSNTDPEQPPKHQIRSCQMRRKRSPGRKSNNNGLYAGSPGRKSNNNGLYAAPIRAPPLSSSAP